MTRALLREVRNVIKSTEFWGAWSRGEDASALPAMSPSGVTVTRDTAQALSAVWACRNLIAATIASLPSDVFIRREGSRRPFRPRPQWSVTWNAEQDSFQVVEQVLDSMLMDGTAYLYTPRGRDLRVTEVWPVHPDNVRPYRDRGQVLYDVVDRDRGLGPVTLRGGLGGEMFHIPAYAPAGALKGMAPLEVARVMMGAGLAAQEFSARFFGQGMHMSGVIETTQDVDVEVAREIKRDFRRLHSGLRHAHEPAVLVNATWKPLSITPEQAQFIETRKLSKQDIATFFLVPPYKIGVVEPGSMSFASVEQQAIDFFQTTLLPWIERLERAFTRYLLFDLPGTFFRFNADGLLRGSIKDRAEALAIRRQWGTLTADEWRRLEDEAPLPDGQGSSVIIPANFQVVGSGGTVQPPPQGGTT